MTTVPFAGTWSLVRSEMQVTGGEACYPLGENCQGRLMVDAQGNFAVQLMRPERPRFASDDILRGTDEELRDAYQGYVAFWSKLTIDPALNVITYQVEGSLFPNWVGHENLRYFELNGDCLTLKTPPFLMAEREVTGVLIWQRLRS